MATAVTPVSSGRRARRPLRATLLALVLFVEFVKSPAAAQEKKDDPNKNVPRVALAVPLGVAAGEAATVRIRGQRLAEATEVQFRGAVHPIAASIKSKGKAEVPQGAEAAEVGDTQVEVELKVPAETPTGPIDLIVVTPAGATPPHALLVGPATEEKEPNPGFRQPQALTLPATVRGRVENAEDVDVFSFEAKAGETIVAEVSAARHGSALDPLLTLYDHDCNVLTAADDAPPPAAKATPVAGAEGDGDAAARGTRTARDPVLRIRCPADGTWFLALNDAHGRGGAAHVYQLTVRAE